MVSYKKGSNMKKLLSIIAATATIITSACWFTESNFSATYIASVNGSAIHYSPVDSINQATYTNGQTVDLPLTVQVKVSDRFGDQEGESGTRPIVKAILQYKIVRQNGQSTNFITVKTLDNPSWKMNFSNPVNLFGKEGIIDISANSISAGDTIIVRVWLSDGVFQTGDINANITKEQIPDTQSSSLGNINIGTDGWQAPHVFRVVFSGKRRLII